MLLTLGRLVCKNQTQTQRQTYIYFYLACRSYSLVRCIDTQRRCSPELFHSRGFIPGQNPLCCPAGSVSSSDASGVAQLDNKQYRSQVQVQVELYCHSAACGDMQWNEMSCLTGPRCYINTDIQQ